MSIHFTFSDCAHLRETLYQMCLKDIIIQENRQVFSCLKLCKMIFLSKYNKVLLGFLSINYTIFICETFREFSLYKHTLKRYNVYTKSISR